MPPPSDLPRGVDVASYQGSPDWDAVKAAGYAFAFTKVTEDDGYVNPFFARNWREIRRAGLYRGAYHFARPEGADAGQEADYFLDHVDAAGGLQTGDMLVLDLEAGTGDLGPWVLTFLHRCEDRAGFKPLVYTGAWFSGPHNLGAYPEIGQYGLWLASYQSTMPPAPEPWEFVAFWQFSDKGQVPGVVGNVDLNVFRGPLDRLPLYGKPGSIPGPSPEPPKPEPTPGETIGGLRVAVAQLADVVCEIEDRPVRLAKAREIREQFVGPRP